MLSNTEAEFKKKRCLLKKTYTSLYISAITCSKLAIEILEVCSKILEVCIKICSKLTIKTPERRHWPRSGVFIVNFEHTSHFALVFLLLTLNM